MSTHRAGVGPEEEGVITVVRWRQVVIAEGVLTGRVRSETRTSVELEVQDAKHKRLEWKSAAPILFTNPSLVFSGDSIMFDPPGQNPGLEFKVKYQLNGALRALERNSARYGECTTGHHKALSNRWTSKPNWCTPTDWSAIGNRPAEVKRWCQPEMYSSLGQSDQDRLLPFCRSKGYLTCSPVACMNLEADDPTKRPIQCLASCRSTQRQWIQLFLDSLPSEWTIRFSEKIPPVQFAIPISAYRIRFPTLPSLTLVGVPNAWHTSLAFFQPSTEWNAPLRVLPSWMSPTGSTRLLRNRQLVDYLFSDQFPHRAHLMTVETDYVFYPNDLSATDPRKQWMTLIDETLPEAFLVLRNQLGSVFVGMGIGRTADATIPQIELGWSKNISFGSSDSFDEVPLPLSPFSPCPIDQRQVLSSTPLPSSAWRNMVVFRLPSWSPGRLCYDRNDLYQAWLRPIILYGQCLPLPTEMRPEDRRLLTGDEKSTDSCTAFYRIPTGADSPILLYIDKSDHGRMTSLLYAWLQRTELDPNATGVYEFQIVPLHRIIPVYSKNEEGKRLPFGEDAIPIDVVTLDLLTSQRIAPLPATPTAPGPRPSLDVKSQSARPATAKPVRPLLPIPRSEGKGFIGLNEILPADIEMTAACSADWRRVIPFLMTLIDKKIISADTVCPIVRIWQSDGKPAEPIELFEPGHKSGVLFKVHLASLWQDIQDCKRPIALVQLGLSFVNGPGHANMMIVDPVHKQYERFEPHGFAGYNDSFVDRFLREEIPKYLPGYIYVPTTAFCPLLGPQARLDPSRGDRCPQGGGFCVMFSALYAVLRALNPTQPRARITNYMVREVKEEQLRKFARWIELTVSDYALARLLDYRPILTSTCPHKGYLSAYLAESKALATSLAWNDCGELYVSTTPASLFEIQSSPRVWKSLSDRGLVMNDNQDDKDALFNATMRMGFISDDSERTTVEKTIDETRKRPVGSGNGSMEQPYHVSTDTMQYELEQGLIRAFPRSKAKSTCSTLPGMAWRQVGRPASDVDSTRQSCRRMGPPPGSIFPPWSILSTMTDVDKANRSLCSPDKSLRSTALWNDFPVDVLWDDCGNMYVTEKPLTMPTLANTDDFLDKVWDEEIEPTAKLPLGRAVARLLYTSTQPAEIKQYDQVVAITRERPNDTQEQVEDGSDSFPIRISTERAARMIHRGLKWLWTQNINYCFLQTGMKWADGSCARSDKPIRIPKTRASQRSTVVIGSWPVVYLLQVEDGTFVYVKTSSLLKNLSSEPDMALLLATGLEPGKELDEWVAKSLTILPITPEWQQRLDNLKSGRPVTDVRIQEADNEEFDSFLVNGLVHKADLERQANQRLAQQALSTPKPTASRSGGTMSFRLLRSYQENQ